LWFTLPLLFVILTKAVLYDEWRHMLFIYPAFLVISLTGLTGAFKFLEMKFSRSIYKLVSLSIVFMISLSLFHTVKFMVKYHPYQNLYFNRLAGKNMSDIKNNFELDYWGLSYRKALEYIVKNDPRTNIRILTKNDPGAISRFMLSPADQSRLVLVDDPKQADYFLSNYRWHKEDYSYPNEYYSIKIEDAKIMVVYKMST
jgi:hypothetical protein